MGKIIFYEDRHFGGRHYGCMSDCTDLHSMFDRCRSIRVESGMFVIYDRPGFVGTQYFMKRGEYSDYMGAAGMNDCVRSCRMIPMIIFYEDRNFQGRSHECSSDSADLHSYFNRCNSIRVESGCFMIYERPNYMGNQYYLRRGEYSDNQRMIGMNDCVRSCRMIPQHRGSYRMRLYERSDMSGQMHEVVDDCPNVQDRLSMSDFNSCNVMDGHWLLYDQPNYKGKAYYLRPGEYRRYSDWGGVSPRVGSLRRIADLN
ncbi:gamma-crystallin 2-like [Lycodopsis pacificus]